MKRNNMKKTLSFVLIFCLSFGLYAQIGNNEKLVFAGSYNMSGLMTQLAQITISTNTVQTSKKTYLHLSATASTFTKWDNFFKIRDLYESYVEPTTLKPSLYKRNILEGNYTQTEKYVFSGGAIKSTSTRMNRPEVNKTVAIGGSTTDIVTMIFKLRKMDLSKLSTGQMLNFTIVFDDKEYPVSVKYMGKETKNAANFGNKECYKFSVGAKTNALRGTDKNLVWLTADAKKIPVFIQFSIKVGTGQVKLVSASGV